MLAEAVYRLTHSTDLVVLIIIAFTLTLIAGWDLVQHNLWIYLFFLATFFGWGIVYTVYGLRKDQKRILGTGVVFLIIVILVAIATMIVIMLAG
jgi:hypothetical protein